MVWKFLTKLSIYVFYNPVITFLGICPEEISIGFIRSSLKLNQIHMSLSRKMDKLIVAYWYRGILFSKRKESTIDTCNIDGFHRNRIELWWAKKARFKQVCIVSFHLYEVQEQANLMCGDRDHISDCPWKMGIGWGWWLGFLMVMVTFSNLVGVVVAQMNTFIQKYRVTHARSMHFTVYKILFLFLMFTWIK